MSCETIVLNHKMEGLNSEIIFNSKDSEPYDSPSLMNHLIFLCHFLIPEYKTHKKLHCP